MLNYKTVKKKKYSVTIILSFGDKKKKNIIATTSVHIHVQMDVRKRIRQRKRGAHTF